MPIYEYKCCECSHRLEKLQKMSDAPLTRCPECGKDALTKLVSAAGFRLKGGGWYETDFKKDGKRNLAGDGGDSKSPDSGGKSDSAKGANEGGKKESAPSTTKSSDSSATSGKSSGSSTTSNTA